ncbi:MAG: MobF family relaxase, partial [Planctomycetaceae bacterium]
RIIESTSAAQATSYYSTADYYTEGQELSGVWRGRGARMLGLDGTIDSKDWDSLCNNRDPESGDRLTLRTKVNRRVGYDLNFHVPKSVSVLHVFTGDERLLDAFRDSVRETMTEMEFEMQTRIRKRGKSEDRTTSNMVWGEFVHFTARPVDELPDPHLHAHCFTFNTTWDEQEAAWKAGQFGSLKRDAGYFEARFHLRLAERLQELGLDVERTRTGWELAGIGAELRDKFSRRTEEIEQAARKQGISDPDAKAELGAKTRSRKQKNLSMEDLREEWDSRLTDSEREAIAHVADRIGGDAVPADPSAAGRAVELAAGHCFERQSVLPERRFLAESYRRGIGQTNVAKVDDAYRQRGLIGRERAGQRMVTSREVLAEEQRMLSFARSGRGSRRPLASGQHAFKREWLNAGQRKAVEHVLNSRDRVMIVRGAAGVGKTSMMSEAVEAIEAAGAKVFTFAPSAKASRGVLREQGFAGADTVERLLLDEKLQQSVRGQVVWIDEAGMIGTRTMRRVFDLAEQLDARVVLSGDRRQHGPVERGSALRLLETEAGLVPVEIREIQRQKERYRDAVMALSEGKVSDGFRQLDELGWVREVDDEDRERLLATDYLDTISAGESALVVSPTHREADRITQAIRDGLKQRGLVEPDEVDVTTLRRIDLTEAERRESVNYTPGDVLIFHQNAKGFTKGQRVAVGEGDIPVDQAARFQVFSSGELKVSAGEVLRVTQNGKAVDGRSRLHNGDLLHVAGFDGEGNILTTEGKTIPAGFGHLAYGYVVTSYQSQGSDVDRVFVGQSADSFPASNREQFYVSASRGRKQAVFYTDCKEDLLDAVRRSDERMSASELVGDRERIAVLAQRSVDRSPPDWRSEHQRREELIHER